MQEFQEKNDAFSAARQGSQGASLESGSAASGSLDKELGAFDRQPTLQPPVQLLASSLTPPHHQANRPMFPTGNLVSVRHASGIPRVGSHNEIFQSVSSDLHKAHDMIVDEEEEIKDYQVSWVALSRRWEPAWLQMLLLLRQSHAWHTSQSR